MRPAETKPNQQGRTTGGDEWKGREKMKNLQCGNFKCDFYHTVLCCNDMVKTEEDCKIWKSSPYPKYLRKRPNEEHNKLRRA